MATLKNTTINDTGYLQVPSGTTAQRPASPVNGMIRYNTTTNALEGYAAGSWVNILGQLGTQGNPATSATQLKNAGITTNGVYYYTLSSGTVPLYTDFTSFTNYPMVMVTKISPNDQNQYLTTANNQSDLAVAPADTTPSRSAKISDADMNTIIVANTIRWVIVAQRQTFEKLPDTQAWYSNFGQSQSCSYTTSLISQFATPSNTPSWQNFGPYQGACGAGQDSSSAWLTLSGIHINDGVYMGGYSGSSAFRGIASSPYLTTSSNTDSWTQGGYVLLSW
jgi:hypothetical protein